MVPYFGDFPVNAVIHIPINTFDSNDPAASVTATNLVNTDVHIHKDGGTTQRNNAAGITMAIDFDSITGNHLLAIDSSDNTVADFFQAGYEYQVRVEGVTVDAGTINAWVGSFSLERAGGALALIKAVKTVIDNLHDTDIPDLHTDVGTVLTNLATVDGIIDNIHDTDLLAVKTVADGIEVHVHTTIPGTITTMQNMVTNIHDTDLPAVKADTAAIKVPTDKLVFTVANQVDSNVITKTGFALSATGADLILKTSTFAVALAAAINELATYGLTALNTLLVTTGIKATTIPAATLAANQHVIVDSGTVTTLTGHTPQTGDSYAKINDASKGLAKVYDDTAKATELTKVPKSDSNVTFNATALASINAEVVDTLNVDTVSEMAQGAPPVAASLKLMVNYLYRKLRNKQETTATVSSVYDDAGTTVLFKETHSDDATTFTKGEYISGA